MARRVKLQTGKRSALLIGAGYVARALLPHLRAMGYDVVVTNRTGQPVTCAAQTLIFDGSVTPELQAVFEAADIILCSTPPKSRAIRALASLSPTAYWVGYLSATSVYGDRNGNWAFEDEAPTPSLNRGRARAEAEIAWIETCWPVHIFRLAGIYGPEIDGISRNPFGKIKAGTARSVIKDGHVVNRIHVDDIISALIESIKRPNPQRIYNIADGNPAPPQEVLAYAASLLGLSTPRAAPLEKAKISAMARTFYSETKRINIQRARSELSWTPRYPNYKAGLDAIYTDDLGTINS